MLSYNCSIIWFLFLVNCDVQVILRRNRFEEAILFLLEWMVNLLKKILVSAYSNEGFCVRWKVLLDRVPTRVTCWKEEFRSQIHRKGAHSVCLMLKTSYKFSLSIWMHISLDWVEFGATCRVESTLQPLFRSYYEEHSKNHLGMNWFSIFWSLWLYRNDIIFGEA